MRKLLCTMLLITTPIAAAGGEAASVEVRSNKADVTVTTDDPVALAGSVIESSLRGVGRMLGAMRGTDPGPDGRALSELGDVRVDFDDRGHGYSVTTTNGPQIWVDAHTGEYSVDLTGSAELTGVAIEESLAAVGAMIRGLRILNARRAGVDVPAALISTGPLGMSTSEIETIEAIWRAEGLSEEEIERRRQDLVSADQSLRASMQELDENMDDLAFEMEALQRQMDELVVETGGGGRR